MMFGLGAMEVLVILVIALVVLGPEKLPTVARQLARTLGELRRVGDDVRQQFDQEMDAPSRPPPPPARALQPAAPPPAAVAAAAAAGCERAPEARLQPAPEARPNSGPNARANAGPPAGPPAGPDSGPHARPDVAPGPGLEAGRKLATDPEPEVGGVAAGPDRRTAAGPPPGAA